MTVWTFCAASVAILEPIAVVSGWQSFSKRPLPLWMAYMAFLAPFRWSWLLAPLDTPASELRPPWTLWLLDGARVLVTGNAIRLLVWAIPLGNGQRAVRWRWALILGFGGGVMALAVTSTWTGVIRAFCCVTLASAIAFSAAWRHPYVPFQAKHAGIMFPFLLSGALASMSKSIRGDGWDTVALAMQAGCAVAWILMLRGKI